MANPKESQPRSLQLDSPGEQPTLSRKQWTRGTDYGFRVDAVDGFAWNEGTLTICFCGSYTLSVSDPGRAALEYLRKLIATEVVHETP